MERSEDPLQVSRIMTLDKAVEESEIAKLIDIRDNVRGVMETISGIPFEVGTFASKDESRDRELRYKGIEKKELPRAIDIFPDHERNRQALVLLGAFIAADYKYAEVPNLKKAKRIINNAFAEGKKRFGKKNPIKSDCKDEIYCISTKGLGTAWDSFRSGRLRSFISYFESDQVIEEVISTLERGRILSHLYGDFPGFLPWAREILPTLYFGSLKSSVFTEHVLDDIHKILRFDDFEERMSNLHISNETLNSLSRSSLFNRLNLSLALQDPDFEKFTTDEQRTGYIFRRLRLPKCVDDLLSNTRILAKDLYNQAKVTLSGNIDTVLEQAVELYFNIFNLYDEGKINRFTQSHHHRDKLTDLVEEFNRVGSTSEIDSNESKINKVQEAQTKKVERIDLHAEGLPTYHEWDSKTGKFLPKHVTIIEKVWDSKEKCFVNSQSSYLTRTPELNQRLHSPPNLDPSVTNKLNYMFQSLKPEGTVLIRGVPKGRFDAKQFTRFAAKKKAGVPARPTFFNVEEKKERSVASMLVLDISSSTEELVDPQFTYLDYIKQCALYLTHATNESEDPLAVWAASSGLEHYPHPRLETKFFKLKEFNETVSDLDLRLNYVTGLRNNRDGAILRHSGQLLSKRPEKTKLLIYISDGEPHDEQWELQETKLDRVSHYDQFGFYNPKYEGDYAWQDISIALNETKALGISPLIIRVHDTNLDNLRKYKIDFRTVKPDMSNLVDVVADAYIHLTK